jgi:hypothetical protein
MNNQNRSFFYLLSLQKPLENSRRKKTLIGGAKPDATSGPGRGIPTGG